MTLYKDIDSYCSAFEVIFVNFIAYLAGYVWFIFYANRLSKFILLDESRRKCIWFEVLISLERYWDENSGWNEYSDVTKKGLLLLKTIIKFLIWTNGSCLKIWKWVQVTIHYRFLQHIGEFHLSNLMYNSTFPSYMTLQIVCLCPNVQYYEGQLPC